MVIFEDLHWIDDHTQAFLNLLADSIGTAKLLLLVNYRPDYSHEWNSKTYYTQLRLDPLSNESANRMFDALLGLGAPATDNALAAFKRLITEKSEGNPLFMEEIVQALVEEGALIRNGAVKLTRSVDTLKIPPTVQAILASRIDRLPPGEKELLQTLAVIGSEFPLEVVRKTVPLSPDELDDSLRRLQAGEFIYEQPAMGDVEYRFKHALTHDVAYNSLLIERRKLLHEHAGQALESLFADQIDDHLTQIAHHYSHSDNIKQAIEYLGAYTDAISSLSVAINLVQKLPDDPERVERELLLQMAVGRAHSATNGYAAPEVERAFTRARELCGRLGDPPELFPTLYGLWVVYLVRGELWRSHELAQQLLRRAGSAQDPELLLYARMALGVISYWTGEFLAVKEHHENAMTLYDPECHRALIFRYGGIDAGEVCLTHVAWTLWQLGYLSQAHQRSNEALALTQKLSNPLCEAQGGFFLGLLHHYRRDASAVRETAEGVIALSTEQGFVQFLAEATTLRGWAMVQQGYHEEGIAQIQEGLAASRAIGEELFRPYFLCLLAEAHMETARLDDGLDAVTQALAAADAHGDNHYRAEMHRLRGELLLRRNDSNEAEARRCFERAIGVARKQSAKSLELRATTSLARLLASQGKRDEASSMLAEIYNWFTEGFDTADLKEAKALLDELNQ
jgi:predicted ATPase